MSSHKQQTVKVPVGTIKEDLFVRTVLNEDRVLFFAELYEAGADVDPIKISEQSYTLVDWRHRKHALLFLEREQAECILVPEKPKEDLILMALESNTGGALPPTQSDYEHTFRTLLEQGVTRKKIFGATATYLPREVAKRYIDNAQSNIAKARLSQAAEAVAHDGMTVSEAAQKFDVDEASLKIKIVGPKKEKKGLAQTKAQITKQYQAHSMRMSKILKRMLQDYQDGSIGKPTVEATFEHFENLATRGLQNIGQWRKRFEALIREEKD